MYSDLSDDASENHALHNGEPLQRRDSGTMMNNSFPTDKLIFGMKKRAVVKYVWTWNTGMLLPFFISGCATAGGEFPGGVVFSFIFVTFIGISVSLIGYQLMLKPELRSEERYGMLLASVLFMGLLSFNEAVDAGSFNRKFYEALGVNLAAVRSTIAFSVFLFLGYLVALYMLWSWKSELGWNTLRENRNRSASNFSDYGRSFDSISVDSGRQNVSSSVPPSNGPDSERGGSQKKNVVNDEYLETEL